ncbi:NUDIX hydrolase [Boudabousia liubingyangii]|uniref:NUDIX hydrolase n=1 Tax=Boudabousia liubingyangii TaxID=1921764 RepID=UPI0009FAB636|nr:NUDIX hydrolase [Boudabousia liubingyangii]
MNGWQTVWKADDFALEMQRNAQGRHRVVAAEGKPGAVVIAQFEDRVLLVRQERPAVGHTLWEFPRGFGDPEDTNLLTTGVRELVEETGAQAQIANSKLLGEIWIDSGLQANAVGIVLVNLESSDLMGETDGEVDDSKWVPIHELSKMINEGAVCDSLSIAACAFLFSQSA